MVSSTPTMSTVPTASPDIGNDYVECHIGEEGYVFSDVWVFTEDSYGCIYLRRTRYIHMHLSI